MSKFLHFFSFLILIFINIELRSQSSIYNDYGKNRIQFKLFKWKYLSSENFNIYYHDNGKRYAEIAIKELENNFNSITNFIGHYPNSKTKIFIFNSASDLNQSNLGINEKEVFLTTNIQTNIKLEFTTFFPGTIQNFLNKLKYDFSNSLINDMMNSEKSFTQRFGKSSSIYLPKWFTNGASKYLAEGWSQEMDNYMRDYFLISDFKKITKITENQAPIIGQSIWNYIINTYGKSSVSNVFNLSKIIKNTPRSFESTLGISFNVLLKNWQDYYIDNSKELISQYELPDRENEIKHKKDDINSTQTKLSPEGNKILYSIKDDNKQKVFIKNLINNKIEKIYSGSNNLTNNYPILNWIDNDKVGIITYYKKENILLIYDFSNKRKEIKKLQNIDQINSFNFNSSSNLLVISASSKGKSDLYLLSTYKNYIKKITNDKWDDIDPVFIPDQDIILFSSNRKSPFLDDRDYSIKQIKDDNYNIFLYHLDTTKLESMFPNIKNIKESVKDMLIAYKDTYTPKITPPAISYSIENELKSIKTLFITGGAGFIGSNFINIFATKYPMIKIINFDALYYCANKDNIHKNIQNSENYKFIKGNLSSFELLKYIFQENTISHVIHFAAQSHVQNSFNDSLQYTMDNIVGTHNLLEINRIYNKHLLKFIHVSTDEVYGESMLNIHEKHKTEHSILCPTNPYAATKASAELIAQSYNHSFQMPIIITRGNNVYGENQYPEKIIPKFIKLLKENKKVTIQGDGSCVRGFLHANDTASAFETILLNGNVGEIYNIGCDDNMEYSVIEVAKLLIKLIKKTENYDEWIEYIEDRPFNDQRYYISNKKVKQLGWSIKVKFQDGLQELVKL